MQILSILEFIYASYTDIRYMEAEPVLIIVFILARAGELLLTGQDIRGFLVITAIVFLIFLYGSISFSLGGADALIAALICINLGFYGIYAIITGLALAIPIVLSRKGKETPLIPFLSIGYVIFLLLMHIVAYC